MLTLSLDTIDSITRFLDLKEAIPLANACSLTDRWWKQRVARDSRLLTLYLNSMVKLNEIACHLDRFEKHETPFDLCCQQVDVKKLIPIQEKFSHLRTFTYVKTQTVISKDISLKFVATLYPKLNALKYDSEDATDMSHLFQTFPHLEELEVHKNNLNSIPNSATIKKITVHSTSVFDTLLIRFPNLEHIVIIKGGLSPLVTHPEWDREADETKDQNQTQYSFKKISCKIAA